MAGGEDLDAGLSAARHHAPWSDLATHRPGHGVLAHISDQLTVAADPRSGSITADGLRMLLRPWALGFVGEEKVGLELALLDPDWRVLHSVTIGRGGADIDHLVIGPPGVFTIDTQHHPGAQVDLRGTTLLVGSKRKPYVRQARHQARRVRAALAADLPDGCPVTPILCMTGATLSREVRSEDLWLVQDQGLVPALRGLGRALSADQVEQLFERARRSTTWIAMPPPTAAPPRVATFARELAAGAPAGRTARPTHSGTGTGTGTGSDPAAPPLPRTSAGGRWVSAGQSPGLPAVPPLPARHGPRRAFMLLAVIALVVAGPTVLHRAAHLVNAVFTLSVPQMGLAAAGPASAYQASPGLPVQKVHQTCSAEGSQGRTFLSGQLLTCQPDEKGTLVWEYANPWRRLPVALQGTRCPTVGEHARNFQRGDSALVCTATDDVANRWIGDPDWSPTGVVPEG